MSEYPKSLQYEQTPSPFHHGDELHLHESSRELKPYKEGHALAEADAAIVAEAASLPAQEKLLTKEQIAKKNSEHIMTLRRDELELAA